MKFRIIKKGNKYDISDLNPFFKILHTDSKYEYVLTPVGIMKVPKGVDHIDESFEYWWRPA